MGRRLRQLFQVEGSPQRRVQVVDGLVENALHRRLQHAQVVEHLERRSDLALVLGLEPLLEHLLGLLLDVGAGLADPLLVLADDLDLGQIDVSGQVVQFGQRLRRLGDLLGAGLQLRLQPLGQRQDADDAPQQLARRLQPAQHQRLRLQFAVRLADLAP